VRQQLYLLNPLGFVLAEGNGNHNLEDFPLPVDIWQARSQLSLMQMINNPKEKKMSFHRLDQAFRFR
jgi:hypothetical protein